MEISSNYILYIGFGIFIALGILVFIIINRNDRINQLENAFIKIRKSFDRLDEQAKLIVKTDIELNKAQEESERRLKALDALQKTSRLISTTLDEKEIFHRLDQSLIKDLGFDQNLILIYGQDNNLQSHINRGFSDDETNFVIQSFIKNIGLLNALKDGNTFSSVTAPAQRKEAIRRIFEVNHFVLSPILAQSGIIGYIFIGNRSNATPITEGDEELISILANQIGQALENARLFEEVFLSRQNLESNIQERTRELEEALNNVKAINKAKSEFISAVSHELRTPLTSVKGYASLLMTGKLGDIPQAVKERLEKINTHSDSLVALINNLLDISRIESGRTTMNIARCNLKKIIENVNDLLTPQMKEKNINWAAVVDPKIPEMMLDSSQIERVFINLVGNAIKFTPSGGTISIVAEVKNKIIDVKVSDTGIGIEPEDLGKLFNEFYRVENEINQNVKGTGLGLALAKKIVEAHGGNMTVTSKVNHGTTFHFTLPIAQT